ncbi:hypothetical protein ACH5RR_040033 [Cinchona calisaya]|uniref:Uncharacterized protein n=1 Tax=Cinchona calisaya TaxID=153742 RepID=A0ABD2XRD6_9GENT
MSVDKSLAHCSVYCIDTIILFSIVVPLQINGASKDHTLTILMAALNFSLPSMGLDSWSQKQLNEAFDCQKSSVPYSGFRISASQPGLMLYTFIGIDDPT